jgi:hypothetical protein
MTIDPRAGKLCCDCNLPKPVTVSPHCKSPTCDWWLCTRCQSLNDPAGHVILPHSRRPRP